MEQGQYKPPDEIGDWLIANAIPVKNWAGTMSKQIVTHVLFGQSAAAHVIVDLMCAVTEHVRERAKFLLE